MYRNQLGEAVEKVDQSPLVEVAEGVDLFQPGEAVEEVDRFQLEEVEDSHQQEAPEEMRQYHSLRDRRQQAGNVNECLSEVRSETTTYGSFRGTCSGSTSSVSSSRGFCSTLIFYQSDILDGPILLDVLTATPAVAGAFAAPYFLVSLITSHPSDRCTYSSTRRSRSLRWSWSLRTSCPS